MSPGNNIKTLKIYKPVQSNKQLAMCNMQWARILHLPIAHCILIYALPIFLRCEACETIAWRILGNSVYFIPYSKQACLIILLMAG